MRIIPNLPLPAYYELCDQVESRINFLSFLSENKISNDEASLLRTRLEAVRYKIYSFEKENDTMEKIMKDLEKIEEVIP